MNENKDDEDRIGDKIKEIEKYIEELEPYIPPSFKEYEKNLGVKAICERYFEKIVEAIVDLAFLVNKEKKLKSPDDEEHVFKILQDAKIISHELSERLQDAKSMRNFIAHRYGEINDKKVFHAIKEELLKDAEEFIKYVERVK